MPSFVSPQAPMFLSQPHGAPVDEHWSSMAPYAGILSVVKLLSTLIGSVHAWEKMKLSSQQPVQEKRSHHQEKLLIDWCEEQYHGNVAWI